VADLLRSIGVPALDEEVVTSGGAAAQMLAAQWPAGSAVLVVGSASLREELRSLGLTPVDGAADKPVAVVQGYGSTVGWSDLAEGCLALRAGAQWMATNTDATMPSSRGPVPGNGSMVAALSTALGGRRPDVVVGKPEPALFQVAAQRRGSRHALVVGDRLDTDIEGAIRAGMDSLLVLTGVSTAADVVHATPELRPTHLAADLRGLSKPDEATRIPAWSGDGLVVGPWRVSYESGQLRLSGPADGAGPNGAGPNGVGPNGVGPNGVGPNGAGADAIDALRALAGAAWANPGWTAIATDNPDGATVVHGFGL
jgi:HAD superfamily hydrolase (TIGR01450 family)